MSIALVMIAIAAFVPIGAFLGLVVKPKVEQRMLKRVLTSSLSGGERVLFESLARRSPSWWQQFLLVQGFLCVTDRRLIWIGWLVPFVSKRLTTIKPEEIESVTLHGTGIEVVQAGRVLTYYPQQTPPFPDEGRAQSALDALSHLKAAK